MKARHNHDVVSYPGEIVELKIGGAEHLYGTGDSGGGDIRILSRRVESDGRDRFDGFRMTFFRRDGLRIGVIAFDVSPDADIVSCRASECEGVEDLNGAALESPAFLRWADDAVGAVRATAEDRPASGTERA